MNRTARNPRPLATAALAALLVGCSSVEKWSVFEVEYPRHYGEDAARGADVPDRLRATTRGVDEAPVDNGVLRVSVEQAVMLALRHNGDLSVAQLQPVIAGAFELVERGRYDPEVFAEAAVARERSVEVARSTGAQFSVTGDEFNSAAGVRQELPTGTLVEAGLTQDRTISSRAPELQRGRLGLTVTQQLLRGFGPAVNLVSVRQARLDTLASEYELRGFVESQMAQTEIAYWQLTLAQERIAIFEKSLAVAQRQRDEVAQRIEVGALPRTEAAAASTEVALREQALIEARSELTARRLRLLRLMNPDGVSSLGLAVQTTTGPAIATQPITDEPDRLLLAARLRPDLNEALLRLEQNRLETIVTRNGLLPRLELFALLGRTAYGDTVGQSLDFDDSETYDAAAGVRFSQYLGNRTAQGLDLAARASRAQAAAAVANLRQQIEFDVRLAVNEVERARQQIAASAVTREFQEQTLRAEQERFNVGAGTALDVAQAQRDLLQSQINEVQSVVAYRVALVNLYRAEGSLLERRGVALPAPQAP